MSRLFFIGIAISILINFFPFFLESNLYMDINSKKFVFSLYLWKIFKLVGGYVSPYAGGIALHISNKKALLLPYEKMESERKKISFIRIFKLISLNITTETGAEYMLPITLMHSTLKLIFLSLKGKKEKTNLWITNGDTLKISAQVVVFFNIFILFIALFKSLKEKIKLSCQKKIKKSAI